QYNPPSRFLREIPARLLVEVPGGHRRRPAGSGEGGAAADRRGRAEIVEAALRSGRRNPAPSSGAERLGLRPGDDVVHGAWGEGVVLEVIGEADRAEAIVRFPSLGQEKRLMLSMAPLTRPPAR
ncbi:MAG: ATP-dependent DNA helicase PcrA, partial [Acidimicrobiales bacterium]